MLETRQVAFFGGQGSRSLFSAELSAFAQANSKSSLASARLLSACHAAFLDELHNSISDHPVPFRDELKDFNTAGTLLNPPAHTHSNPIVQGVTLCAHQLLGFLSNAKLSSSPGRPLEPKQGHLSETVGFCSGILPAVVIAKSSSVAEYIAASEAAIRLAYWIGYRTATYCEKLSGAAWREEPWSLALNGYSANTDNLQGVINKFNTEHSHSQADQICISVISGASSLSVVGSGQALQRFRSHYLQTREGQSSHLVYVHGLYHGGPRMEAVVQEILEDAHRRQIPFPAVEELRIPLRMSTNGEILVSSPPQSSLAEIVVKSILMDQLDWVNTWDKIPMGAPNTTVLAFGTHSTSLLSTSQSTSSGNVSVEDLSGRAKKSIPPYAKDSIAIVGMACQFPNSSNKHLLWETLEKGINTVEEIPVSRFNVSDYYDPEEQKGGARKMAAKHGNFLDSPWAFDHSFFNVSPREAKSMDPQQRLLLQGALNALNDAGYVPNATPSFQRDSMGCYVGVATGDYVDNLRDDIDVYYSTGTLRAFLSGKISHFFKWTGPSVVVDTACSASSVALYQACRALKNGDCTAAIAGGVNAISSPDMFLGLSRAHFLSKTGQCKAFDASADGYCRSEGCGLFVLKRLEDALSENDRIYGVIRSVEVNQCGNAHSITHPHSETQQALFKQVLARSGVDPTTINVVEAHGTGTQAGDAAESSSIQSVFGNRPSQQPLYLTSVKGNIGHAEAASGAAGLSKLLMMLHHKKIPPQAGYKNLNPKLSSLNSHNIKIATTMEDWRSRCGVPRRALLNNFGAAGSNAAILLEEAPDVSRAMPSAKRTAYPFIVSARSPAAVQSYCASWIEHLEKHPGLQVEDVAYTATARRQMYGKRLAFSCSSVEDLIQKLKSAGDPANTSSIMRKPIGFVFSGQGAVYPGMGEELLSTSPVFASAVAQCDSVLSDYGFSRITPFLNKDFQASSSNDEIVISQCACFVLEYALAKMWMSWGIVPGIVMGHSLGEYAAMAISGIITLSDALKFVATRAKLMTEYCEAESTSMLACNISSAECQRLIDSDIDLFSGLSVACQNSWGDSVISGPISSLDNFSKHCKSTGIKNKRLDVPFGFHSAALNPILEPLSELARSIKLSTPTTPFGSTVSGRIIEGTVDSTYFTDQTRNSVQFANLTRELSLREDFNSATYIEIGPAPITLPMMKAGLTDGDSQFLPSLKKNEAPWATLVCGLNKLLMANYSVQWRQVFDGALCKVIDAPEYPLNNSEMFVPYKEPTRKDTVIPVNDAESMPSRPLIPKDVPAASDGSKAFETDTDILGEFIQGHVVGGVGLCPASIYHEMVLEAVTSDVASNAAGDVWTVHEIIFDKPLIYDSAVKRVVRLTLDQSQSFEFSSFVEGKERKESTRHCYGTLQSVKATNLRNNFLRLAAIAKRQQNHIDSVTTDTIRQRMLYDLIFPRVVQYGKKYQSVKELTVTESGSEGYGRFKLHESAQEKPFVLSPTFVDTLLHAAGFIANSHVDSSEACICTRVEHIDILYEGLDQKQDFKVYCSLLDHIEGTLLADAYAITSEGVVVAVVEGMHFKRLQLKSFQNHLARLSSRELSTVTNSNKPSQVSRSTLLSSGSKTPKSSEGFSKEDMGSAVADVVSQVCEAPRSNIAPQTAFSDLGVDSLMQIELADALKKKFPNFYVDKDALLNSTNVQGLQDHILSVHPMDAELPKRRQSERPRPVLLHLEEANFNRQKPSHHTPPVTPPGNKAKAVIAEICGIEEAEIDPQMTVESLGMDSLMMIELKAEFQKQLGIDVPDMHGDDNLEGLFSFVNAFYNADNASNASIMRDSGFVSPASTRSSSPPPPNSTRTVIPTLIQSHPGNKPPLYLFHDGSGTVSMYNRLSPIGCTVYGIANPSFGDGDHWAKSLSEMASAYASAITAATSGPVILGGWSFGGVLAFETAHQLRRHHPRTTVTGIILIDAPYPKNHTPLPVAIVQHILKPGTTSKSQKNAAKVASEFAHHAGFLGVYEPTRDESSTKYVMLRSRETFPAQRLCGVRYEWLEEQKCRTWAVEEWKSLGKGEWRVKGIPGDHFGAFGEGCVGEVGREVGGGYSWILDG